MFFCSFALREGHLGNDIWLLTVFSYAERASAVQRFSLQSFKMMLGYIVDDVRPSVRPLTF